MTAAEMLLEDDQYGVRESDWKLCLESNKIDIGVIFYCLLQQQNKHSKKAFLKISQQFPEFYQKIEQKYFKDEKFKKQSMCRVSIIYCVTKIY